MKKIIFCILLTTITTHSHALVWENTPENPIPKEAIIGGKVTICHLDGKNILEISENGLKGHRHHLNDSFYNNETKTCLKEETKPTEPICTTNLYDDECTSLKLDITAIPFEVVVDSNICKDNSHKYSELSIKNATIKRTRISNSFSHFSTISLNEQLDIMSNGEHSKSNLKYGEFNIVDVAKIDFSNAKYVSSNQVTNVKLNNITMKNAYIDTLIDYIDKNGEINPDGSYLQIYASSETFIKGIITYGIITKGVDDYNEPVRGRILTAFLNDFLPENTVIKGRRLLGTITDATISNAKLTVINDKVIVDYGIIESGFINDVTVFGTVEKINLFDKTLKNINRCFFPGNIGLTGQLNWKEVIGK